MLNPRFIQCMNVEEENHILMKNKEIVKRNVQIAEQKAQLTEKDAQLMTSIQMLAEAGLSTEDISQRLKLPMEIVKRAIG